MCKGDEDDAQADAAAITTPPEELRSDEQPRQQQQQPRRPRHPYANASWFSRLFFLWPWPLLKLGMQRPLTDLDLADVETVDSSQYNLEYLRKLFNPADPKRSGLRRALVWDFFKTTWFAQPFLGAAMAAKVTQAIFLGKLVDTFEANGENAKEGFLWAMGVVFCGLFTLFDHHHVFFFLWRKGMQFRVACVAAIYQKALRLSSTHQETLANNGRIMNLASNDVERFMFACLFVNNLFWAPVQALGILAVGTIMVGPAFCVGIALLVLVLVPLQIYLSRRFAHLRSTIAALTDQRVSFVSQAVRGARVMKMSGYEEQFAKRIRTMRAKEVRQLEAASRLKAANEAMYYVCNIVVSLVIFLTHVYWGGVLQPGDVYAVFTLVNVMQLELVKHVSLAIMATSECNVSIGRIQQFLEFPEIPHERAHLKPAKAAVSGNSETLAADSTVAISMQNVSCRWDAVKRVHSGAGVEKPSTLEEAMSGLPLALENVSVDFHHGSLTAVVGPVGSGKSALLQALVQELTVASGGSIQRNYRTLAYASQDPWVMDGTIRDNILMGLQHDADWYSKVVEACSLGVDFAQLRDGDNTVVGDRGVQLSGGQRARIGLARALYKDADVLVADDPLSAVDARVGRHLFRHAILDMSVERQKCVILATHQHQFIHDERCLLILDGKVTCDGSYEECVAASLGKLTAHEADEEAASDEQDVESPAKKESVKKRSGENQGDGDSANRTAGQGAEEQEERNVQGAVHTDAYWNYLKAMGGPVVGLFMMLLFACTQGTFLVTVATMGRWAELGQGKDGDAANDAQRNNIVATVVAMSVIVVVLACIRAVLFFEFTIKASQLLHDRMTASILRARIEFFDTHPLGRILNRFSADVGICDEALPQTLFDVCVISLVVLGAVVTAITTLPFVLAVLPFLIWYFVRLRRIFVNSTRELKRLEGKARSPIFAMLSEALGGIATIRANEYEDYFSKKFRAVHDAHTRTFFAFISSSRWLGFRMDSLVFMFLAVVCFLAVWVQKAGWFPVEPAILGLTISMLIYLSNSFQWCVRQSAEAVNQMVSVERVLEFGKLDSEAELHADGDDKLIEGGWPAAGKIEYDNVSARYRSTLPLALKGISFQVPAGARVGVVGRTGSGKSTVVQSLFRLLEAEEGGCIRIDDQDVAKVGLHALRTKISVIPQVPTLFSGCTVRENLDLFQLHSDEEIRDVIEACHLEDLITDLPLGWNSPVSEGGANFSVGQRQLLCLARAILARNNILVLDEATASVDRKTDQMLQQTLQESYQDGTILAVAHRLDTVIEYDYILVLGHGEVLEFGPPADLLAKDGMFSRMVHDTGEVMSKSLREKAKAKAKDD